MITLRWNIGFKGKGASPYWHIREEMSEGMTAA